MMGGARPMDRRVLCEVVAVTGIWRKGENGWQPLRFTGFPAEAALHNSIEASPEMLPIPGRPRLVIVGREVPCASGLVDLVAVDADTGQPVIIEIKLRKNTDRRKVFTQVLDYASVFYRLAPDDFAALLLPGLAVRGIRSLFGAVAAGVQDGSITEEDFAARLARCLAEGRIRCVVVIDEAPEDMVRMAGYLQDISNDRLDVDVVTVTAYEVGDTQILVPQLVEPGRVISAGGAGASAGQGASGSPARRPEARPQRGGEPFGESIASARSADIADLRRLYDWACGLEADGLAVLYTTVGAGAGRWALNVRIPGQQRGMITIWNDNGAYLSPFRSVIESVAPKSLGRLDEMVPGEIRGGSYVRAPLTGQLLTAFRDAYVEARGR
jgi:hypothetical protein